MSNEGTYAHEYALFGRSFGSRAQEDEGEASGISPSNNRSLGGTSGFGPNEIISNAIHPSSSLTKRSRFEFDVGDPVPQILPPFVGELERDFQASELSNLFHVSQNTLPPELFYQHGNMGVAPNYGNYHLPTSNFTAQLHGESSSSVQLLPTKESCPQNQKALGAANGAPCFPTTQWTNNPNLHQLHSQLSTGLGAIPEMMQSRGFSSFPVGGRSSNNESQSPNTQQHGAMGNIHPKIPNPREMGESSSRNVKMKRILSDINSQQSTELQMGSLLNPTTQGNPRVGRNSLYDPMYEQMGLPVDPHLRVFVGRKRRQCNM